MALYWGRLIFSSAYVDPLHFYFSVILFGAEYCPSQFIVQFTSFKIIFKNIFSFYLSLVFIGRRVFIQQFMALFIMALYWGRLIFPILYVDPLHFLFLCYSVWRRTLSLTIHCTIYFIQNYFQKYFYYLVFISVQKARVLFYLLIFRLF